MIPPLLLDPAVDNVDENLLNLAYNDQQIDVNDEINGIESRKCCAGIFAGRNDDHHRIRESTWQFCLMSFPIN